MLNIKEINMMRNDEAIPWLQPQSGQLLLQEGINRCPFQLLRYYKRHEEILTRVRLDRNVAPCNRPTASVIVPLYECKKVCPCSKALPPSGSRAWIKQGRKKRKKRGRETGKKEARRLMEIKAAQQNKTHRRN